MVYHKAEFVMRQGKMVPFQRCRSWRPEAQITMKLPEKEKVEVILKVYMGMGTDFSHKDCYNLVCFGTRASSLLAAFKSLQLGRPDRPGLPEH